MPGRIVRVPLKMKYSDFYRINECSTEIADTRRKRDADLKALEATTKELATMSDAEKQRIIVQISAVQTDLKRTMDERYILICTLHAESFKIDGALDELSSDENSISLCKPILQRFEVEAKHSQSTGRAAIRDQIGVKAAARKRKRNERQSRKCQQQIETLHR